jgi:hypothetical protein
MTATANHAMRRALHEIERVRALARSDAEEVRNLRESVRKTLIGLEQDARAHVNAFAPLDVGEELRLDLKHKFRSELPNRGEPQQPPSSFDAARDEWAVLAAAVEKRVRELISARTLWEHKVIKRRRSMPTIPDDLWRATERLSELHAALPRLREQYVAERLESKSHLNGDLAAETARRQGVLEQECARAREVLSELDDAAGLTGGSWGHPGWLDAAPASALRRVIRIGQFEPRLPQLAGIGPVPALLDFPFGAGIAIATDVERRAAAIDLARSIVLRTLAATPPGGVRYIFVDPVSLGRAVADFRHLAEFDPRLVDAKTWTSERDVEARLEELSDHLEVVISTYLRGQFDSIDEYNHYAGEVAEPYRVLVVFDYPAGFTARSSHQLLSLIENGTRCGVHTIVVYDPAGNPSGDVTLERLVHSMQRVDLTTKRGVELAEPIGAVDLDFLPDASPPIAFSADGRATSPFAQLLLNVGEATRTMQTGPVTLERVVPIINRQIAAGRAKQLPQLIPHAPELGVGDPTTWWTGVTAEGAFAPIGRAGAQDVAALYFSSTEIAGGAIVVGLPRSGKSTALHAAIVSLSIIYPPEELELYLIDSKHGVEFKSYERLPHARLVSINSEREFSVSVLHSLDGEIKRRAELMKRHTAGRANITEYRSATGERLPRVVLVMDEFHELFEEDDALGQEAFQAFSNIVRQGPFAGVHAVVASQTLSSMPAMDRSTLSLLPMRVAFMCNDTDADLVMGDTNREVKALSQQGEGIFNPSRGDSSRNKPFRGTYIAPDERSVLLSSIEERAAKEAFGRQPKVFDGDILAARPEGQLPGSTTRPVFTLGEPFNLEPWAGVTLRRGRGANVLVIGAPDEGERPDRAIEGALHSCLADAAGEGLTIHVVDFIGDAEENDDWLDVISLCRAIGASYRRSSGLADALKEVGGELTSRMEASDYGREGQLLVLNGVERALDLAPADAYGDPDDPAQRLAQPIAEILRDGPEFGCHALVVTDRLSQFDRRLGRDALKEFDWRVAGTSLGPGDITAITDSYREGEVRPSQLLLVDGAHGRSQRVRAYPRHTPTTIETVIQRRRA